MFNWICTRFLLGAIIRIILQRTCDKHFFFKSSSLECFECDLYVCVCVMNTWFVSLWVPYEFLSISCNTFWMVEANSRERSLYFIHKNPIHSVWLHWIHQAIAIGVCISKTKTFLRTSKIQINLNWK